MARIHINSRLRLSPFLTIDDTEFWGMIELPDIPDKIDDQKHRVIGHDRLDTLANDYYGDPVLKFIIAQANNIEIEPTDLRVGEEIRIPSPRFVREQYFKQHANWS